MIYKMDIEPVDSVLFNRLYYMGEWQIDFRENLSAIVK
jgi:hypothetical protein